MVKENILYDKNGIKIREQPNLRRICLEFGENLDYEMVKTLIVNGIIMGAKLARMQMGDDGG